MGQAITTSQFYLYGRKRFTQTGWAKASASYKQGYLEGMDLNGRIFMVTGANSGIGKEVSRYMASKGGTVYMVCRNKERAEIARSELVTATGSSKLHVILGDVSLRDDCLRIVKELEEKENKLDALVCNAGALADKKTLTKDGVEQTFACHLLNGSYLLSKTALPLLEQATEPRVIFVSSGGMYNTKFPKLGAATAATVSDEKFDGQLAYAFAKRGQVLLAERWTQTPLSENVKVVSCHPGWVNTPGVEAAYGTKAKYLEPMRDLWQGSEGICWLGVTETENIEGGGFYLDRSPQTKHLAGYFMSEGKFTKNSAEDVDAMMALLESWSVTPGSPPVEPPTSA
eukprot:m.156966 g.156966  ORF g.156966 m.156966 type:complete len:342 (-) comp31035_c1_seq1:228-1253(-)